ncbi:MAG TPA: GntR family transcriptional regulator [Pseudonocardiaceae bacterium]|nr:GntR family transcriptional regulator [Pseudonocardiaceae bacterium]
MPEMLRLPASRTELVLEEIRRAILTRELLPGQPLVEMELAQRLGVSKTPVREALKLLSGSGLVTFNPYKGASVRVVDRGLAKDVYDVRLLLEPEAVRRSVRAGDPALLAEASKALDAATLAVDKDEPAELSLFNRTFHQALYRGCGNPLLISVLDDLRDRAALISVAGEQSAPNWRLECDEHRALLATAQAGDADGAAELTARHITGLLERTMAVIDADPSIANQ